MIFSFRFINAFGGSLNITVNGKLYEYVTSYNASQYDFRYYWGEICGGKCMKHAYVVYIIAHHLCLSVIPDTASRDAPTPPPPKPPSASSLSQTHVHFLSRSREEPGVRNLGAFIRAGESVLKKVFFGLVM